jgi:osmotically-inducible protein OsmY
VQDHLITVTREGRIIYLRGRATSPQARDAATRAAAQVPGVHAVVNELEV